MNHESMSKEELIKIIKEQQSVINQLQDQPRSSAHQDSLGINHHNKSNSHEWLEHSPVCTKIVDLGLNLSYMSKAGVDALNIKDINEFYGKPYPFYFYPDSFKIPMTENLKKSISSGKIIQQTASVVDIEGNELWFHSTIVPVRNKDQEIEYLIVVSVDITEQKNAEKQSAQVMKELIYAKEKAESADKAKSEFLATMSHEIRTPMNGVLGLTEIMLRDQTLNNEQKDTLNTIHSSGESLINIINDILDFSKVEANQMEFESIPFFISDIIRNVISIFNAELNQKNIDIQSHIPSELDTYIEGDPNRIRQILVNLISNSVKFTKSGRIDVSLKVLSKDHQEVIVYFEVKDTGIGIPTDRMDILFKPFTQADMTTTRQYGGTGLGLAICKKYVNAMQGEIGVKSMKGQGSTFWFTLPFKLNQDYQKNFLAKNHQNIIQDLNVTTTKKINILSVDDNSINQKLLKKLLKENGYNCDFANNGKEAVDMFKKNIYQLILMDLQMPVMDGFIATKKIRSLKDGKNIPIIAISASILPETQKECIKAGANHFIKKPIDQSHLIAKIQNLTKM